MNPTRRILAALALAVLVAAGCSSSNDATDIADPDTTTAAPDLTESEPVDEPDPAEPEPTEMTVAAEPVELTASFRGVTEDIIRVGVVAVDFDRLAEAGVQINTGDAGAVYTAALEAINDRGGIHGRQLEITTETYLPIGNTEADEACVRLTEDIEVFIVVGLIRLDQVLCYTEANNTAAITISQQNQQRIDRSTAPYVSVRGRTDTRSVEWVDAMAAAGVFDGETVGVLGLTDADEELFNETVAALRAAGIDPVEGLVGPNGGDVVANQANVEVVLEKFRSEGVTVTVHASPTSGGLEAAARASYETTWLANPAIGANTLTAGGVDHSYVDGMLSLLPAAVGTVDQPAMADDPAVAECVAMIEERTDELVDFALDAEIGNVGLAINACGAATIFELALTAAGPNLTNDTLTAALAGLGEFDIAGFPSASLGPDDYAATGAGELARFSAADAAWEFVS
jgi:ABC-type branched-subunit amino acid transport system substrate-binding protein